MESYLANNHLTEEQADLVMEAQCAIWDIPTMLATAQRALERV